MDFLSAVGTLESGVSGVKAGGLFFLTPEAMYLFLYLILPERLEIGVQSKAIQMRNESINHIRFSDALLSS